MNIQNPPKYSEASHHLTEIHKLALSFHLLYQQKPDDANQILEELKETIASIYNTLPPPEIPDRSLSYDYATYFSCIQQLHDTPLIKIDIGDQTLVTQAFINIIVQAQRRL
ncbi:hypothetical protein [Staphylococcus chromogenes]|uniref:hypothetical protein n=1 Tax=Staphylococcus chromogenes TaxID=46126 RepID=UPI000D1B0AC8|nr:hypothetical protein [Staphylococcus chromogenes]PTG74986.1 hypothetical protein BU662_01545 [Staphylococcus chromogenes]